MKIDKHLPDLPYNTNALTPLITEETFDYHYGKHHAAYVKNLNNLIKDSELEEKSVKDLIILGDKKQDAALFNNAAQHWNHSFFWHCLSPNGGGSPEGKIKDMIIRDFNSFDNFKDQFSTTATNYLEQGGRGWLRMKQVNWKLSL